MAPRRSCTRSWALLAEEEHNELLRTLTSYLANDRRRQTTADELGIHRQTLGYRLRQIEAHTDRSLKSSRDIAELWIAVTAHDLFRP
ncbi:helix-turn-helix domain-containing protein [Streptomyces sp. SP18BB07]|uniref:helix-turn-helix domain-containing protein n=1 Tax=Streptomyces sp. SP18BB07 TaxID=3002522 RepID=UPI002E75D46F|nr:helix-turn-helix domain-containing protein [Streptomyces sp. SP18BB07]MEE1757815.1 helix-turn-helix domain-containing protein [Streptomyces sp. SP18BB07]